MISEFPGISAMWPFTTYALKSRPVQHFYRAGVGLPPEGVAFTNLNRNGAGLDCNCDVLQIAGIVAFPYCRLANGTMPCMVPLTNSEMFFRKRETGVSCRRPVACDYLIGAQKGERISELSM